MRWLGNVPVARLPLRTRSFAFVCIASIVVIRLAVVMLLPRTADFPDLRIYQGTGQAVLAGVNPYDFADQPTLREELRSKMAVTHIKDTFCDTLDSWNYYVSGNLPVSTALYALFESVASGSRFVWRLLLILGDIAIFLGLVALVRAIRGSIENGIDQVAVFCLSVINPLLIVDGCALPEEKQFQTALMLFAAALLLSPKTATIGRALGIGLVLSLSVLFKLFGIFLLPMWCARAAKEWPRFALWTAVGGLTAPIASIAYFGWHFIGTMSARGLSNSVDGPLHASPWIFLPGLVGDTYLISKAAVVALFCAVLIWLAIRRRIDPLNCCAGIAVAFACLWLDKGGLNRMNITMVFAVAALASLRRSLFLTFSSATVVVGCLGYAIGVGLLHVPLDSVHALLVLIFVSTYLFALITVDRFKHTRDSSRNVAIDVSRA